MTNINGVRMLPDGTILSEPYLNTDPQGQVVLGELRMPSIDVIGDTTPTEDRKTFLLSYIQAPRTGAGRSHVWFEGGTSARIGYLPASLHQPVARLRRKDRRHGPVLERRRTYG